MNMFFDFFDVPPVDPSSVSCVHVPSAAGSQETRRLGQIAGSLHRENLWSQMLEQYAVAPLTDAEMALALKIDRSTVNGRRGELMALGKVQDMGITRKNARTGIENTVWGLVR